MPNTKQCSICHLDLAHDAFSANQWGKHGQHPHRVCRKCRSVATKNDELVIRTSNDFFKLTQRCSLCFGCGYQAPPTAEPAAPASKVDAVVPPAQRCTHCAGTGRTVPCRACTSSGICNQHLCVRCGGHGDHIAEPIPYDVPTWSPPPPADTTTSGISADRWSHLSGSTKKKISMYRGHLSSLLKQVAAARQEFPKRYPAERCYPVPTSANGAPVFSRLCMFGYFVKGSHEEREFFFGKNEESARRAAAVTPVVLPLNVTGTVAERDMGFVRCRARGDELPPLQAGFPAIPMNSAVSSTCCNFIHASVANGSAGLCPECFLSCIVQDADEQREQLQKEHAVANLTKAASAAGGARSKALASHDSCWPPGWTKTGEITLSTKPVWASTTTGRRSDPCPKCGNKMKEIYSAQEERGHSIDVEEEHFCEDCGLYLQHTFSGWNPSEW